MVVGGAVFGQPGITGGLAPGGMAGNCGGALGGSGTPGGMAGALGGAGTHGGKAGAGQPGIPGGGGAGGNPCVRVCGTKGAGYFGAGGGAFGVPQRLVESLLSVHVISSPRASASNKELSPDIGEGAESPSMEVPTVCALNVV